MIQTEIKKKQDGIVELLKQEILSGNIPDGTEMTQNELAESLGVSRMPVREALILLEYQGLIRRLPNNHVQVTEFSPSYFSDIFDLCASLEQTALEQAAAGQTPGWQAEAGSTPGGQAAAGQAAIEQTSGRQAAPARAKAAARPRLFESVPEELLLHRQISQGLSHSFFRKTLDTILEIYVDFGIRCPSYDQERGLLRLKTALAAPPNQRRLLLKDYFDGLERAIWNERNKKGLD